MDKFFFENIYNVFFPIKCGYCDEITGNGEYVCNNCKHLIIRNEKEDRCKLCGTKLLTTEKICNKCNDKRIYYNEFIYFSEYSDLLKDKMLQYKFYDKKYLKNFFAYALSDCLNQIQVDYIIGVPISQKRLKERGYNQTNLIAKEIGKKLNIEYISDMLVKIKETSHQSKLSKSEREVNVKNAFKVSDKYSVEGKNILLIDDIFTTGSTVNECSRILKLAKASNIVVSTVLRKK